MKKMIWVFMVLSLAVYAPCSALAEEEAAVQAPEAQVTAEEETAIQAPEPQAVEEEANVTTDSNQLSAEEAAAEPMYSLSRMVLCSGIQDREPIDEVSSFTIDAPKAYAFIELAQIQADSQITVVWSYQGDEVAEVPLNIGQGNRWRTYSSKNLAGLAGDWQVEIRNDAGESLSTLAFKVQ